VRKRTGVSALTDNPRQPVNRTLNLSLYAGLLAAFALPFVDLSCSSMVDAPLTGYQCAFGTAPGVSASVPLLVIILVTVFGFCAVVMKPKQRAREHVVIALIGLSLFVLAITFDRPSTPRWFPLRVTRGVGFWLSFALYAVLLVVNLRRKNK
jgi:hypothetical protein